MMMRVILCDDQEIVTEGMQMILRSVAGIDVVGIAHDGAEAVELVNKLHPDLVLMDLRMPIMNGIQATQQIRQHYPDTKVLVLTTYDDDEWVFDAVRAGASGYLLKDTQREQIIAAMRGTVAGMTHVDPKVAGKLLNFVAHPEAMAAGVGIDSTITAQLSEREIEILRLIAGGLSNAEIADRLHLSKGTVQNYVSNLFVKLDVTDRTQAAIIALRHGLGT
jgi:DNA-binding NarL/FixJ family response regulator